MSTPIFQLCDEIVQKQCELNPILATARGVSGDFGAGVDLSPDGHAARAALVRDTLRRLAELTPTGDADRLAATHLRERMEADLAWHDTGEPLREVRAPFGLLQFLRTSVDLMPRGEAAQWRAVGARMAAIPEMLAGWRRSLAEGLSRGLAAAHRQAVEVAAQADRYADHATYRAVVDEYGYGPLREELAGAADRAHRALTELAGWLRTEYAPRAQERDGVGPDRYAVFGRLSFGTEIDPREAYQWAWLELRRLEAEMAAEAARIRPGAGLDEAIAHLNETEYLTGEENYRAWLQERHDRAIADLDGVHFDIADPLRTVVVATLTGSSAGAAYYTAPSEDLSRPGRTWWPVADRERFGTWAELSTVFHEGVPGHHLQLGQMVLERDKLSRYSRLSRVSAHSEGWALYAERLADELGWFDIPGGRLGMLKGSAVRAARVVVDTGIHLDLPIPPEEVDRYGPRWTFEVATEVLRDRGRLGGHRLHPELVRYCGWPAQASSYKLGERAWLAAREEAQRRLGPSFDLKEWHTRALALGPVGLGTLTSELSAL